jgi:hypothetical protein
MNKVNSKKTPTAKDFRDSAKTAKKKWRSGLRK